MSWVPVYLVAGEIPLGIQLPRLTNKYLHHTMVGPSGRLFLPGCMSFLQRNSFWTNSMRMVSVELSLLAHLLTFRSWKIYWTFSLVLLPERGTQGGREKWLMWDLFTVNQETHFYHFYVFKLAFACLWFNLKVWGIVVYLLVLRGVWVNNFI